MRIQPLCHASFEYKLNRSIFLAIFQKNDILRSLSFGHKIWPYRLTVRTPAFQAVNPGSIPGRVTKKVSYLYFILIPHKPRIRQPRIISLRTQWSLGERKLLTIGV